MPKPKSRYAVHSTNTGAIVCGPVASKAVADRECRRLNKEAATGCRADDGEPINYVDIFHCAACQSLIVPAPQDAPEGIVPGAGWCPTCESHQVEVVSVRQIPQRIAHEGVAQGYEVRTDGGVVIG